MGLPPPLQAFEVMGDARHKKSPPNAPSEVVTPDFRAAVRGQLSVNRLHNKTRNLKPGDPDYRISNHAELADAVTKGDKTMINRIIGAVRPTTKIDLVHESRFVGAIRVALGWPPPIVETVEVPADRAAVIKTFALLPRDLFDQFARAVNDAAENRSVKSR